MLSSLIVRLSPSFETTIHELVSDVLRDIIGRMTSIDSSIIYVLSQQLESLYSFAVQVRTFSCECSSNLVLIKSIDFNQIRINSHKLTVSYFTFNQSNFASCFNIDI